MNIARLLHQIEKATIDNSPAILTAAGIVGTLATAYLTGKASFKAAEVIEAETHRKNEEDKVAFYTELSTQDKIWAVWRLYLPAAGAGVLTVVSIFSANRISTRRAAGIAAAYSISEKAFSEYKEKVQEKMGEKKERGIRDELAQDRVNKNPSNDNSVIITDGGEVLCYDQFTGRYFKSSMEVLKQAGNEINYLVLHQGYASLSDFYHEVGIPSTSISEELGWNTDQLLELDFSTVMSNDGRPCIAIDFNRLPTRSFDKFND